MSDEINKNNKIILHKNSKISLHKKEINEASIFYSIGYFKYISFPWHMFVQTGCKDEGLFTVIVTPLYQNSYEKYEKYEELMRFR